MTGISWPASEVKIIAEINKLDAKPFHYMGQRSHTHTHTHISGQNQEHHGGPNIQEN